MNKSDYYDSVLKELFSLKDKELFYISHPNKSIKITDFNHDDKAIYVDRAEKKLKITFEQIKKATDLLFDKKTVHFDTDFHGSGNERTVIETLLCHTSNIGYMKPGHGKYKGKRKSIKYFDVAINKTGEKCDVSDDEYIEFSPKHKYLKYDIQCLYKPFILLSGISGTGKTRFIREQVKDYPGQKNYCLVPVRPDWHEPSDLLGYISRISGKKEYVSTPVLHFITQAWIHIFEHIGEVRTDGKIGLSQKQLDHIPLFWLCLDEMNLAPVEQYFADYLSVLETRHWYTSPELTAFNDKEGVDYDYVYQCAPLLKADTLSQQLDDSARIELAEKLGLDLDVSLHQQIWASFCQHGIAIPFNLMVAGTVNMDETTHGFSRKVIDRALTFDFNEFFPNDFDAYFSPALQPKRLGYPTWSDGRAITEVSALEQYSKESVTFLKAVNGVLQQSPFELAYRALNELMLALLAHHPANTAELVAIWDDFMMCKVLPRIEGDSDKLRSHQTADGDLLTDLEKVLAEQFGSHWDNTRPDLFNCKVAAADEDSAPAEPPHVPCRSKKKLAWMKERLARQCFTSFWP
ncbi:hypothetical protein NUK45_01525 [Aeromonas veronii]|uniref:McrB family protein n=1 Tax=Aeromonas veronii TaxID=654 RepID=UPI00214DA971|nr:hypothetical protein [Aeromonas veronii]MCR3961680.1 hypothetical protein [Aeromonas veronii]